jgi:hypothetical protein
MLGVPLMSATGTMQRSSASFCASMIVQLQASPITPVEVGGRDSSSVYLGFRAN